VFVISKELLGSGRLRLSALVGHWNRSSVGANWQHDFEPTRRGIAAGGILAAAGECRGVDAFIGSRERFETMVSFLRAAHTGALEHAELEPSWTARPASAASAIGRPPEAARRTGPPAPPKEPHPLATASTSPRTAVLPWSRRNTDTAFGETTRELQRRTPSPNPQQVDHQRYPAKGAAMTEHFDVIVIGTTPAGESAAGRLHDGGQRVAVTETELIGGERAYWACIP
jgi:hypothetical protein